MTILKKFDPEPDLCPLNIKLSAYNNSKIPVLGKCSLTLKHKKDPFDVSFIVVDSKSLPILQLATSESLNLIESISAVNVSDEQFLSELSDCFKELETLKNTYHIEIKDNVTLPKGMLEIAFASRFNRDAKSFPSEFFQVYLVSLCFSSQTWISLMILFGIKL